MPIMSSDAPLRPYRPTSVTVIGWLFVGFGALALLGGIFGTIMSFLIPFPDEPAAKMIDAPPPFRLMSRLFDYFGFLAAAQVAVAIIMICSGVAFLRLQSWARTAIEAVTWLGLTYNLAFGAFWIWAVVTMWREVPAEAGEAAMFFPVFIAFGAAMIVAFSIPPIVIIRVVRGHTVRTAVKLAQSGA
jgi:hypothetical protein